MADDNSKKPDVTAIKKAQQESDEIRKYYQINALGAVGRMLLPPPLVDVAKLAATYQVQNQYAITNHEQYMQGEDKELRAAIARMEPITLPKTATPTRVGAFVMEDTANVIGSEYHGNAAAAIFYGVLAKISGTNQEVSKINRIPAETLLGMTQISGDPRYPSIKTRLGKLFKEAEKWNDVEKQQVRDAFKHVLKVELGPKDLEADGTLADLINKRFYKDTDDRLDTFLKEVKNLKPEEGGLPKEHPLNTFTYQKVKNPNFMTIEEKVADDNKKYSPDMIWHKIKESIKANSVNIFSISEDRTNVELLSSDIRRKFTAKIEEHFGPNAIRVLASGNSGTGKLDYIKFNALNLYSRNSLSVGALHTDIIVPRYKGQVAFEVVHHPEYSEPCDVCASVPDTKTGYGFAKNKKKLIGTSFSAPHMAADLKPLMERFVHSAENPDAVLKPEHILLAIKQTAMPLVVGEKNASDFNQEWRSDKNAGSRTFLHMEKVNGRQVNKEGGNGRENADAAWKLLEAMEKKVKESTNKVGVYDRVDFRPIKIVPTEHHKVEKPEEEPEEKAPETQSATPPKNSDIGTYEYKLNIDNTNLIADNIILDLHSKELKKAMNSGKAKLWIVSPNGSRMELDPITHADQIGVDYIIARVPAMQGTPIKGEWRIISTGKLDEIELSFPNAMQPNDVGAVVKPEVKDFNPDLFKNADLRGISFDDMDKKLFETEAFKGYELSQTAFPEQYLQTRLLHLLADSNENNKNAELANNLAATHYHEFDSKNPKFLQVVKDKNTVELLQIIAPDKQAQFDILLSTVRHNEKKIIDSLIAAKIDLKVTDEKGRNILFHINDKDFREKFTKEHPELATMTDLSGQTAEVYWNAVDDRWDKIKKELHDKYNKMDEKEQKKYQEGKIQDPTPVIPPTSTTKPLPTLPPIPSKALPDKGR